MGGPKLRGRGKYIEQNAAAIDRFRRAYGALSDDDGATDVPLPDDNPEPDPADEYAQRFDSKCK